MEIIENPVESISVERIAGGSRYDTATLISKTLDPAPSKAIVVTGINYADALSISPYAALMGYPIVYANPNTGLTA